MNIVDALVKSKFAKSKSDARRLIRQGGISLNSKKITSIDEIVQKGNIIKKGKRFFVKAI